jgi:hypothetical protein
MSSAIDIIFYFPVYAFGIANGLSLIDAVATFPP